MTLPEITIMWFWLAIIALLCWSGSDLFSKIGCRDGRDKYNPLKMVIAVGVVMGIHAAYEIFIGGAVVTWSVIWTYLPVSLLYIGSMTLGYVGLRYIELSISSPICNSSGALFETAGQFAYIYALADEAHVALSAPIISAYCAASVLWGRIFLKEKLSWKHYVMIALVVIGIVMIGVFDI